MSTPRERLRKLRSEEKRLEERADEHYRRQWDTEFEKRDLEIALAGSNHRATQAVREELARDRTGKDEIQRYLDADKATLKEVQDGKRVLTRKEMDQLRDDIHRREIIQEALTDRVSHLEALEQELVYNPDTYEKVSDFDKKIWTEGIEGLKEDHAKHRQEEGRYRELANKAEERAQALEERLGVPISEAEVDQDPLSAADVAAVASASDAGIDPAALDEAFLSEDPARLDDVTAVDGPEMAQTASSPASTELSLDVEPSIPAAEPVLAELPDEEPAASGVPLVEVPVGVEATVADLGSSAPTNFDTPAIEEAEAPAAADDMADAVEG